MNRSVVLKAASKGILWAGWTVVASVVVVAAQLAVVKVASMVYFVVALKAVWMADD